MGRVRVGYRKYWCTGVSEVFFVSGLIFWNIFVLECIGNIFFAQFCRFIYVGGIVAGRCPHHGGQGPGDAVPDHVPQGAGGDLLPDFERRDGAQVSASFF